MEKEPLLPQPPPPSIGRSNHLRRSKTAPAMVSMDKPDHSSNPGRSLNPSILKQGTLLLITYLTLGIFTYSLSKDSFKGSSTHPAIDAVYFCIVTMCTIGYGDITPDSPLTKLFAIAFALVGFGFVDFLLTGLLSAGGPHVVKEERRMRVRLAAGSVVGCVGAGSVFMRFVEGLDWVDSFYMSVMSVTTVGYGDRVFRSPEGRVFASVWLLVSTLAMGRAFVCLAEARVDRRRKRVLGRGLTIEQFLDADTDNNGFVSKSEYVVYMLKEMGQISEEDVLLICKQFERLDAANFGKISYFMENP